MASSYSCPHCGSSIETTLLAGDWARCPACSAASHVPVTADRPASEVNQPPSLEESARRREESIDRDLGRDVRRDLAILFGGLWFLTVLQFHGCGRSEMSQHGLSFQLGAAVPPSVPLLALLEPDYGPAIFYGSLSLLVIAAWMSAVRHPRSRWRRVAAPAIIVIYWFLLWFPMALGI